MNTNANSQGTVPLISVVVAVRNAAETIAATFDCLAAQTLRDFEVVLIDGASTDGTMDAVSNYGELIAITVSEPDGGIADAWNKGVARCRGDWVIFLNAGDLLHARHFERASAVLSRVSEKTIVYCDVLKFDSQRVASHLIRGSAPSPRGISRGSIGFGHPGSFAHRRAFDELGMFDTSLRIAIDTDFLLRCVRAGYRFERLESTAYMAEGGVSDRRFEQALREYFDRAVAYGLADSQRSRQMTALLPRVRTLLHVARRVARHPARVAKHALVSLLNSASALFFIHSLRHAWFRALGFRLGAGSSIGMGLRFYRTGRVTIGDRSVVNRDCLIDNRGGVTIGHDVSIARDVHIYTAGHDPDSPMFEMTSSPVTIEDHAVVFARSTIMPGVTIGRGAVVYGGSLVASDVPAGAIVGGSPARFIRSRAVDPSYRLKYPYPQAM